MKYIPDPPSPGDFKTRILWPQESLMQGRGGAVETGILIEM